MRSLAALMAHSRATVLGLPPADEPPRYIEVGGPGGSAGGGGIVPKLVRITALHQSGTTFWFEAKELRFDGETETIVPVEPEVAIEYVHVFVFAAAAMTWSDLRPRLAEGMDVPIVTDGITLSDGHTIAPYLFWPLSGSCPE